MPSRQPPPSRPVTRRLADLESENQRLRQLVLHDETTGLANRRAFLARLEEEVARARRYGGSFSVLLLDVDGLKDINDTFGHQTGDAALRHLGERLAGAARAGDLVARISGDEFAVIAVHGRPDESAGFAARFAMVAAHSDFRDPATGDHIALSAAAGIATYSPEVGSAKDLFARADQNLNEAKHSGVVLAAPQRGGAYVPRGRRSATEEVRALLSMARDVAGATDPVQMLRRAAHEAARLVDAGMAAAGLIGSDGRLRFDAVWMNGEWSPWDVTFGPGERLSGRALRTGEPQLINRAEADANDLEAPLVTPAIATPIRAADGRVIGVLTVAGRRARRVFTDHDLTIVQAFADLTATVVERAHAHAALESAHTHLRGLMDNASDAILVVDPVAGMIVDANRAAAEMTGYTHQELLRIESAVLRAPESQEGPSLGQMAYATRRPLTVRRLYRRRDGTTYPVEGSATLVESSSGPSVFMILRDVSAREAAEAEREALLSAVQRSAGHLRRLQDIAADIAGNLDLDTLLERIVRAATEALDIQHNALMLYDERANDLVTVATVGLPPHYARERRRAPVGPTARTSGRAAYYRAAVITDDVRHDPYWAGHVRSVEVAGLRGVWAVPLIGRSGQVLGTLTMYHEQPSHPSPEQLDLARIYAGFAAVAIENARAYADASARRKEAEALLAAVGALRAGVDRAEAMRRVVEEAARLLEAERAAYGFVEGEEVVMRECWDGGWRRLDLRGGFSGWIAGHVAGTGISYLTNDLASDPITRRDVDEHHDLRSQLCVPVIGGQGRVLGIITVSNRRDGAPFGARELSLMAAFAQHAALALEFRTDG